MASFPKDGNTDDYATISDAAAAAVSDHSVEEEEEEESSPMDLVEQSSPFHEGEYVLAYYNRLIYKAKVQRVDPEINGGWRYSVHYIGWSKNWDEWVGIGRLLKYTEENIQKQLQHNKNREMENNAKTGSNLKSSAGTKGKKRKKGAVIKEEAMPLIGKRINIAFPTALKKQLVNDWECVTQLGKLVKLPRSPNVNEILTSYQDYRLKKDSRLAVSVGEIIMGLRLYFDKAVPALLLYKNERRQYQEAITNDVAPSAVYGAEHLLRLFVKLPGMLQNFDIEEKLSADFQQYMADFLKFLQKNQSSFFLGPQQSSETIDSTEKQDK